MKNIRARARLPGNRRINSVLIYKLGALPACPGCGPSVGGGTNWVPQVVWAGPHSPFRPAGHLMDRDIPAHAPPLYMNTRVLEVLAALGCLILFIALLVMLPAQMVGFEGLAYVIALVAFIAALSTAGYVIDKVAA